MAEAPSKAKAPLLIALAGLLLFSPSLASAGYGNGGVLMLCQATLQDRPVQQRVSSLERARQLLQRAGQWSDNASIRRNLGRVYLGQDDPQGALNEFSTSVELDASNQLGHFELGRVYYMLGDTARAVAQWRVAKCAPHFFKLGNDYILKKGDYRKAEEMYILALALAPDSAEMYYALAGAYWAMNEYSKYAWAATEALKYDTNRSAQRSLVEGQLCVLQGEYGEAANAFRRATELDASYPGAHLFLGVALMQEGFYYQAIDCFKREIQENPSLMWPYVYLGEVHELLGNQDEAQYWQNRAAQANPALGQ